MLKGTRPALVRYAVTIVAVALALVLTRLLWPLIAPRVSPLFFAAVILSTLYGGLGPGLLATALAALATTYFLIHPLYWLAIGLDDIVRLGVFVLVVLVFNSLSEMRKRADAALREANQTLQAIIQASPLAIIVLDLNGNIKMWSPAAERLYGWSVPEVLGRPLPAIPEDEPEELRRKIADALAGRAITGFEAYRRKKDGTPIHVNIWAGPLSDATGEISGVASVVADITERKRTEQRLAAQHAVTRILAGSATINDAAPKILQAVCESLGWELGALWGGYQHDEEVVLRCIEVWHSTSADVTEFVAISRRHSLSPGAGLPGRIWASGEPIWISDVVRDLNSLRATVAAKAGLHRAIGFPVRLGNQILGVLEFFGREIQPPDEDLLNMMAAVGSQIGQFIERKRAEQASAQLASIVESSDDAIIGATLDRIIVHWNAGAEKVYGYVAEEVIGQSILILSPPERSNEAPQLFERITRGERVDHFETVRVRKDGRQIIVSLTMSPIRGAAGRITGVSMIARDITERKQAEQALRESEAKFRAVAESAAALMFIHQGAHYLYANPTAEAVTGYTREELLAMNFWEIVHPDFQELVKGRGIARLKEESVPSPYEVRIVTKGGEERWVEIAVGSCHFEGKSAALGTAYDITQRKRAEEERAQLLIREQAARKEAEAANRAKDEFLAMISHELRTPLTAIQGWARLLRSGQLDAATSDRALESIERNTHSQAQLIEELLDISRIVMGKLRLQMRPVEIASVIKVVIEAIQPAADAKGIHLMAELDPDAGPVSGDAERLQQVVRNLLANAVKFTPGGGRVEVRLERVDPHVLVTVSDTGIGISPEFLPHIFDRFSQESERSHGGVGLGLAIVRHLVELHQGTIQAESPGKGQGTTFRLKLLRAQPVQVVNFRTDS